MNNTKSAISAPGWNKEIFGWSLYDFANTIYSMNIVSLYLKRYIVEDLGHDDRYFDIPFSLSMLLAALLLPALGAISDYSTKKKYFVLLFTVTCCIATGLMSLVPESVVMLTILLFILANFSYEGAQPFYNALLYSVADGRRARFISGVGVAFGYVGSVLGMLIVLPFVTGSLFSINIPFLEGGGLTASFLPTAILFLLFSIPLFLWVKERPVTKVGKGSIGKAYRDVWEGVKDTKKYPGVLRFLIADYFVEDAVATVIVNIGLYCSIVIGLEESEITLFLIISTITAVFGSFAFGWIARQFSLKKTLSSIMLGWVIALLLFVISDNKTVVWILGSFVGILLGGLWTTSRPLLAELVPREDLGRFFGLFSLSGRAAAVIGPLVWTTVVYYFASNQALGRWVADLFDLEGAILTKLPYKVGILSLAIMMLIGYFIFQKVPDARSDSDG